MSRPSTARLWEEARRVARREARDGTVRQDAESSREGSKAAERRISATSAERFFASFLVATRKEAA